MTAIDTPTQTAARDAALARRFQRITQLDTWLKALGLPFVTPILRMLAGDKPRRQWAEVWRLLGVPILSIAAFPALWASLAPLVQTSLGVIPGPVAVWEQSVVLNQDAVREGAKADAFYAVQDERNDTLIAEGKGDEVKERDYTGRPTYSQQIWTSIQTVFFGFVIAAAIAVPSGIVSGLSPTAGPAISPFVQIFKPVSPLV